MNEPEKIKSQPVKVYIRQRPFERDEIERRVPNIVDRMSMEDITLKSHMTEKKYVFDGVFSAETSQVAVYDEVVSPFIEYIIAGYNCTVFAYGQTGTGKTYTMIGSNITENTKFDNDPYLGMIPRACTHLFRELKKLATIEHTVRISFVEIYNEEVRDLLSEEPLTLKVYDDPENKGSVIIRGLSEVTVCSVAEIYQKLVYGATQRQIAATNMNRNSSRSHTLFTVIINTREALPDGEIIIKTGKLHLVDLAGSENIGRSGATNVRAREAGTINKSLLTLGKVIKSLAMKDKYIPYRDSKLTRILQDSLGGKTKTCMIATFSPSNASWEETISTLDYAQTARNVSNRPQINVKAQQTNLKTNLLKRQEEQLRQLRKDLAAARAGEGFYLTRDRFEEMSADIERVKLLKKQLQEVQEMYDLKRTENENLQASFNETNEYLEIVRNQLQTQEKKMKRTKFLYKYLDDREVQLSNTNRELLNVCKTSANHENLLHQKYANVCDVNVKNVQLARQTTNRAADNFEKVANASMTLIAGDIKACEDLEGVAANLESIPEDCGGITAIEEDAVAADLSPPNFDALLKQSEEIQATKDRVELNMTKFYEAIQDGDAKIENYKNKAESAIAEEKTFTAEVEGKISRIDALDRQSSEIFAKMHAYLAKMHADLAKLANDKNELVRELGNDIRAHKEKETISVINQMSLEIFISFQNTSTSYHDFVRDVMRLIFSKNKDRHKIAEELDLQVTNAMEQLESYRARTIKATEELAQIARKINQTAVDEGKRLKAVCHEERDVTLKYVAEVQQLAKVTHSSLIECERSLQSNIHQGDTPAKPNYKIPLELEERLPVRGLLEDFKEEDIENPDLSILN